MSFRKSLSVAMATCILLFAAPVAEANIFTGTCVMNLTFNFDRPIKAAALSQGLNVGYDIVSHPITDLNPLDGQVQQCVVDTSPLTPFRPTEASGSGRTIAWTCEAAAADGSWDQSWDPDPAHVSDGSHTITGTWGNWLMVVKNQSLSFTGHMNLTVTPQDQAKLAFCASQGISTLHMTGVLHFQDPEMPPV